MKLYATIAVHVQATGILRAPRFLDKLRRAFGGRPDLRTGTMRSAIEATAVVEGVRDAVRKVGANNAISLVIDETVLFHDRDGKPDDLGDLFLAFAENESVFGQGFDELRLAVGRPEGRDQPQPPDAPGYDPYVAYYPSPLGIVPEMLLWSTLFSMASPPHYVVVDHGNHIQGFADDPGIQHGPTQAVANDGGSWWD